MMELKMIISGKQESERLVSIIQLGLLTALEEEIIGIDEAEGYLFNPYTAEKLEAYGFSNEVIDIIWEGCELEDIERLVPEKLLKNIREIKQKLLSHMASCQGSVLPIEKIIK